MQSYTLIYMYMFNLNRPLNQAELRILETAPEQILIEPLKPMSNLLSDDYEDKPKTETDETLRRLVYRAVAP